MVVETGTIEVVVFGIDVVTGSTVVVVDSTVVVLATDVVVVGSIDDVVGSTVWLLTVHGCRCWLNRGRACY